MSRFSGRGEQMNYPIEQCMVGILENPALWKQALCGALWGTLPLSPTITDSLSWFSPPPNPTIRHIRQTVTAPGPAFLGVSGKLLKTPETLYPKTLLRPPRSQNNFRVAIFQFSGPSADSLILWNIYNKQASKKLPNLTHILWGQIKLEGKNYNGFNISHWRYGFHFLLLIST